MAHLTMNFRCKHKHSTAAAARAAIVLASSCSALFAAQRLTMQEAEAMALQSHPQLQSVRYGSEAAKEVPEAIRARLKPQAFASSSGVLSEDANTRIQAGGLNNPVIYNRLGIGVGVSQLVTDFGRTKHLALSAERKAEAANEGIAITRAQILLRVRQAYYSALTAQAVLRVASETVKTRELVANRAEALAANKLKSDLDASFAKVDLQEGRLLESNAENAAKSAMVELSGALGLPAPGDFELVDETSQAGTPPPPPPDWEGVAREALANRPELKQARLDHQAASEFVKAESALNFPTVTALLSTGVSPFHAQRLQGHWNAGGIIVDLPFLNGGLFRSRQRQAAAQEKAAESAAQEVANRVARDVRLAYLNTVNAYQRLQLNAALVEQARQSFVLAKSRYDLGLGSIVEVSQAQLNLTRAEISQAGARFDYQASKSALEYQKGTL